MDTLKHKIATLTKSDESLFNTEGARALKIKVLKNWVKGKKVHINIAGTPHHYPDLSCCYPPLLAPKPFREKYLELFLANEQFDLERMRRTFDQYWSKLFNAKGTPDALYYTDWMTETHTFGLCEKIKIMWHMRKYKVKL